ncbi:MAG: hypothetical protein H7Y06_02660 [Opitutaceae bacterium]|nr:hypothetical protein [Opitutaceae bacterium]
MNEGATIKDLVFDPLIPVPAIALIGLVLAALTLWTYLQTARHLSPGQRWSLVVFRLAACALVLLILLQPSRIEPLPVQTQRKVTLVAIDASRSMRQPDAGKLTRFDAARELLWDAGVAPRATTTAATSEGVRLFGFGENATPLTRPLAELRPERATTQIHASVQTMLGSLAAGEGAHALFLLTDGHDFELVNPAQTALAARNRQVPIYVVPFGGDGTVRDVSVRMSAYQPFHYAKQTVRLTAALRPLGCPYETVKVTLMREGRIVQSRSVVVRDEALVPLSFDVTEEKAGQFEYEIRVDPLAGEVDTANNRVFTYLNIIDKKIRVLLMEGRPYWDTTFLQRSLRRNEKLELDSVVSYAKDRWRVLRTEERKEPFRIPSTSAEWNTYDLVILGQGIDLLLTAAQTTALQEFVDQQGGVVVFARGDAFSGKDLGGTLQPVKWGAMAMNRVPLQIGREGRAIAPFRLLADAGEGAPAAMPDLIGAYQATDRKALTATLAQVDEAAEFPAMVHRRQGAGQVLSIGVDGLWRWAFNAKTEQANTVFDRFWDQTVLWLMRGRDIMPDTRFTFRADTANVLLGEKIRFRIIARDARETTRTVPVTIFSDDREVARLTCSAPAGSSGQRLEADFIPEKTGRYRAEVTLPDASRQVVRFATYDDNVEETDVAADLSYLRRLSETSGGRVLRTDEFAGMLAEAKAVPSEEAPRIRKITAWDRTWIFWLIGALFGADWYLRRRWGLC